MNDIFVYHAKPEHLIFTLHAGTAGNADPLITALNAGFYKHVATVTAPDLEDAFEITNNIDRPWCREGYRSTSCGDIMIRGNYIYAVIAFGFKRIGNLDH